MITRKSAMPLNVLVGVGISFVILTILLATNATILDEFSTSTGSTTSYAYNITQNGLEATDTLSAWTPLIALVMAAGIIIASVMFFIGGMGRRE
jgi:hypothetical protein